MLINEMEEARKKIKIPPEITLDPESQGYIDRMGAKHLDQVTDEEFEEWLAKKYTTKNDFKMKSSWFKDTVLYVLISLDLKPTMGNYRKYDPILDWKEINLNDLRRKGIIK
ncbi:MAG: hypothetical protein GY845_23725 [Planctomycetes bacterium]|nr:hypothetical protein [Planctomycetota bacterium]